MSATLTLWEAAAAGNTDRVRELLEAGVVGGVDAPDPSHKLTALQLATRYGHEVTTQVLLDAGAAVSSVGPSGWTACHVAARYGRYAQLRQFSTPQPLPHTARDHRGRTPLHLAAVSGCPHTLLLLLHSGADPTAHDQQQRAPLHVAVQHGHLPLVQLLQHWLQPEDVAHMDVDGYNVLHVAAAAGDVDVLRTLLPDLTHPELKQLAVEAVGLDGMTPLALAVRRGHVHAATLLMEHGAQVHASVRAAARAFAATTAIDEEQEEQAQGGGAAEAAVARELTVAVTWSWAWYGSGVHSDDDVCD